MIKLDRIELQMLRDLVRNRLDDIEEGEKENADT